MATRPDFETPIPTLQKVRVKKDDLLDTLQKNMETHRDTFLKAQDVYRERVIDWLEMSIQNARDNKKIANVIGLPTPEDHTADYERVIKMLQMSQDTELWLTEQEISQYVLDNWGWKERFRSTTASYVEI